MRFVRYNGPAGPRWGQIEAGSVHELDKAPYSGGQKTGRTVPLDGLQLLAPVEPSKLICIGRNYAEHAAELGNQAPSEPMFFLKAPSSLIGSGEAIVIQHPEHANHWEAELAVMIGKQGYKIPQDQAMSYIFGYTMANDVSDRDFQKADAPFGFGRGKSMDTYCPCGPELVTEIPNPLDTNVLLTCNGEVRQNDSTSLMLHPIPKLISFLSNLMTLMPGDVILTGTPKGVGPMKPGDTLEITIAGLGTLRNPVK
jgi:2-keto-4-pentenoate hydratase/2-oxohepta-3-ene-1,7-dioic acid hydratase in catechol pathway